MQLNVHLVEFSKGKGYSFVWNPWPAGWTFESPLGRSLLFEVILNYFVYCLVDFLQRENAVDNFRAGKTWVLIATDVIARGMDFKGVNCVINYDFPDSAAAYVHRIG